MKKILKNLTLFFIAFTFILLLLFPLYIMIKISISNPSEIFSQNPTYLIKEFTLNHFRDVLQSGPTFFMPLYKSILTAFSASLLALFIALPAAYAIARFNYKTRYFLLLAIFVTRMIPEISIALSVSTTFMRMGLFDTTLGLVLAHVIRILPVTCFILVGVFSGFPRELEEQAYIDGCSRLGAIVKIIIPLSLGGISVAGIFSFLLSWDEFIYASYLTLANPTMPLKMYYYISRGDIFSSATYAVFITVPVLILTLVLQKYLRAGYLSGAIKG